MPAEKRRKAAPKRPPAPTRRRTPALDGDNALLALLIGAMASSGHVSAEEAERAHNIIWAMRRFRHRSGEAVGRRIDRMRQFVAEHGPEASIGIATRALPRSLRPAAYAVAADLVLVDGRLQSGERRFLARLAREMRLDPDAARAVLDVIRVKNSA